jgi:hypothetical protein
LNTVVKNIALEQAVFDLNPSTFDPLAVTLFRFQHEHNPVYRQYCDLLAVDPEKILSPVQIPFMPISFFKTHRVTTGDFVPQIVFESSGTGKTTNSRHYLEDLRVYEQSFTRAFQLFYGEPKGWCIVALLPSYLERDNSSLVAMVAELIRLSGHANSGFFLNDWSALESALSQQEKAGQKTMLIGVSFALLDFAAKYPMPLQHTIIMETGGMKGRKEEMTRQELHGMLRESFRLDDIHSEYGMTELLSQAYSHSNGLFTCPPWMKVFIRDEDDPFCIHQAKGSQITTGALNIIDLANIYSCAFIATDDGGRLHGDGRFEVLGRLDDSDVRGCSLLAL